MNKKISRDCKELAGVLLSLGILIAIEIAPWVILIVIAKWLFNL